MSKSKGNVVDPDEMIRTYGADTTRLFLLFAAPPEKDLEWSDQGVAGCYRFLHRVWSLIAEIIADLRLVAPYSATGGELPPILHQLRQRVHQTIQRVTADIEDRFHFNTAIAALMELVNDFYKFREDPAADPAASERAAAVWREAIETLVLLLSPMTPHLAEELWWQLGYRTSVYHQPWPPGRSGGGGRCHENHCSSR